MRLCESLSYRWWILCHSTIYFDGWFSRFCIILIFRFLPEVGFCIYVADRWRRCILICSFVYRKHCKLIQFFQPLLKKLKISKVFQEFLWLQWLLSCYAGNWRFIRFWCIFDILDVWHWPRIGYGWVDSLLSNLHWVIYWLDGVVQRTLLVSRLLLHLRV